MGMDLYKYIINNEQKTENKKEIYVGRNLNKEQLDSLSNFNLISKKIVDDDNFWQMVLSKFGYNKDDISKINKLFFWDLRFDQKDLKPFVLKFNEKTLNDINKIDDEIDKLYLDNKDTKKSYLKLEKYYNDILNSVKELKYSKFGEIYFLDKNINTDFEYFISCSDIEEIGYMRKPFKHYNQKPTISNDKTTFYIGNFAGTDVDKLRNDLFNKCIYHKSEAVLTLTENHNYLLEDFLNCIPEHNRETFTSLFPIKNNEVISIDW